MLLSKRGYGIYRIRNIVNQKFYIGSTKSFQDRERIHFYGLNANAHHCKHLQNSFNKHGADVFVFEPLENCPLKDLIKREQWYIDNWNPQYNTNRLAGKPPVDPERSSRVAKQNWESGIWDYRKRPVNRVDPNTGEIVEYISMLAAEWDGFEHSPVWHCCNGEISSYANYFWEYADGSSPQCRDLQFVKIFYDVKGVNVATGEIIELTSYDQCHEFGFSYARIRRCCSGRRGSRTHCGFSWEYLDKDRQQEAQKNRDRTFEEAFCKPVISTNIESGEEVHYRSMAEAVRSGFELACIQRVLEGEVSQHKGYYWREQGMPAPVFIPKFKPMKPIEQLTVDGVYVKIWTSKNELSDAGYDYSAVWSCCEGRPGRKSIYGFRWRFADEEHRKRVDVDWSKPKHASLLSAVVATHMITGEEKEYISMAAAKKDGFSQAHVSQCCAGKRLHHKGYYWRKKISTP